MEKGTKSANLGNFKGLTPWRRDPTQRRGREGGLDKPRVHRGIAKLRRSVATVHSMKIFVFGFSIAPRTCLLD